MRQVCQVFHQVSSGSTPGVFTHDSELGLKNLIWWNTDGFDETFDGFDEIKQYSMRLLERHQMEVVFSQRWINPDHLKIPI